MEIKYWSDIACPFCYIGSNRMKKAMKEIGIADETTLEFKSFELDHNAPKETNESYLDHFTRGNKAFEPQAKRQMTYIQKMADKDGLPMAINDVIPTNTFDAHRLVKLADSKKDPALTESVIARLYKVYFKDGDSIADHAVLLKAATETGLDEAEVKQVLNSDRYRQDVLNDENEARQSGINSAPFFVINNKYAISGAQSYSTFVQALKKVQEEEAKEA